MVEQALPREGDGGRVLGVLPVHAPAILLAVQRGALSGNEHGDD